MRLFRRFIEMQFRSNQAKAASQKTNGRLGEERRDLNLEDPFVLSP